MCGNGDEGRVGKFTITRGVDNVFTFVIKANGTTLPIEIQSTDTFSAIFRKLADGETVLEKPLTVVDALSGKTQLTLTTADTALFIPARGKEEDRFYVKAGYSLVLQCNTAANGVFTAKVEHVYVD